MTPRTPPRRYPWWLSGLLGALILLIGVAGLLVVARPATAGLLPLDIRSHLRANYSADPRDMRIAAVDPQIIAEVLQDQQAARAGTGTPAAEPLTIPQLLQAPVPSVTLAPGQPTATPAATATAPPASATPTTTSEPASPTSAPSATPLAPPTLAPTFTPTPLPTRTRGGPTSPPTAPPTRTSGPTSTVDIVATATPQVVQDTPAPADTEPPPAPTAELPPPATEPPPPPPPTDTQEAYLPPPTAPPAGGYP
ncbi:MAG: hypothetical protein KA764_06015 [Anaerolineales bacterium]|nr:hypothetical protein [Anaerolineales bacterium]